MNALKSTLIFVGLFGLLMFSPQQVDAQRWLQTSQLIVPIETDSPTQALLDTLVQVIERKDSVKIRRTAESSTPLSLQELRDNLIAEQGIGLRNANRVFIDYKFMIGNRGYEESIESFQFLYRPQGQGQEDVRMMYVDATQPWVNKILRNKGTSLSSNQAALKTFSDQLAFARMQENEGAQLTSIAGQPVREGFEEKKQKLVEKITRLTYDSM